jgi:hypothetical protein
MDGRYWAWLGVRLLIGVVLVGWAFSYLNPGGGSGEKEFQRTLDALKTVQTVRVAQTADQLPTQHSEMLWEISCGQDAYHYKWHIVDTSSDSQPQIDRDEIHVANVEYDHLSDDSWSKGRYAGSAPTPRSICTRMNQGADAGLMPGIATMIRRGILQKGDKKTVSGVRCREWLVTMKGPTGLEHDTVCLGLDDHLPYEATVDWQHLRNVYSDYNSPLQLALPESAVQPASATTSSN